MVTATACISLCFAGLALADTHRVLMLGEVRTAPGEAIIRDNLRAALDRNPADISIFEETLDILDFPTVEDRTKSAEFLRAKYAGLDIDVVIALGPSALAFLAERSDTLFAGVPLVYGGVRPTSVPMTIGRESTGVVSELDVAPTVDLALTLQPHARRLIVVTGVAPIDASWSAHARDRLLPYRERIDVSYLEGLSKADLLEELRRVSANSIVVFLAMRRDGAGVTYVNQPAVVAEVVAASPAPVYVSYETFLGDGAVGGHVESFGAVGEQMAELTLQILNGVHPVDLPPVKAPSVYAVDWRALRRFGFDEAVVPPGTIVSFREPSLWRRYRIEILGALSVIALQTLLIVVLLLYIRKRRTERTLKETQDRYDHVVQENNDLIRHYRTDTTLTFVNDAYCRYAGRGRDELVGRKFVDFVPETERPMVLERVRASAAGRSSGSYVHQAALPDGRVRWQQWLDHPIIGADGNVAEIQGIGRDITELKTAETEAQQRREQVTHLTRVAILGELSGALAHELNQPMTAILSNAQAAERLLRQESPDLIELREIVKDIVADDVRAGEVIRRLRTLLKPGTAAFHLLDVSALFVEVLTLVRAQFVEQNITVIERFSGPLPPVHGDRVQLQQVLLNLLMNGCEAMRANEPSDRTLVAAAAHANGVVTISVSDNGSGLAPNVAERLFEPFFTTKAEGLGLGLSICRSIVSLHGGSIAARNNPDRGATVELVVPAARGVETKTSPILGGADMSAAAATFSQADARAGHSRRRHSGP